VAKLLPRRVQLRFKRFGEVPVALNPANITHHQILHEFVSENAYDLAKVPFRPAHIIDCGAHIGLFLRLCRSHFPEARLTGFEPQESNYPFAVDAAPSELLDLQKAAVGATAGTIVFDDDAGGGFGSVTVATKPQKPGSHVVQLVSLPQIITKVGDLPLLLKIDIEGAERELLPELVPVLPRRCALFLETHHGDEGWARAVELLTSRGFSAEKLRIFDLCVDGFFVRS
jgi:FkbM family methyltransferase